MLHEIPPCLCIRALHTQRKPAPSYPRRGPVARCSRQPVCAPLAGHPQPLRTIVDVSVTRHARVYCGSGKADVDVGVAVADMLQHTRAEVVDVAVGARPSVEAKLQEAAALLPLPWPPGAEMVRMIGVVAQRRR